ncbi:hypothetical protein OIDMADRAFT_185081 [Oidiodendron maius Zn]|uniref:FAD/NAD(P)-binding domain-containing protein n=1 Tax=Oidiodendron maius (strain Zn) TaxID=913774 RepID=A0A0C3C1E4_OIDMZ|nr:hypothetical protein OIDMADRAFT_185081 [Oidiodendron maius Zn]
MNSIYQRTPAVPVSSLTGSLPSATIAEDVNHNLVASSVLGNLYSLDAIHLTDGAIWRDLYAMTGTLRTFVGSSRFASAWKELSTLHHPSNFKLIEGSSSVVRVSPSTSWVQARFTFETEAEPRTHSSGIIGAVLDLNGGWKIWLLSTILEQIDRFPNPDILETRSPTLQADGDESFKKTSFDCVVVGAGMAGLCTAGRLETLGMSYVVLERNKHIGDNWTQRYESVRLHTSKENAHLPFGRTFSPEDPYFLGAEDLARAYQKFVDQYRINVWLSTNLEHASWNEEKKGWSLQIQQNDRERTIQCRHLVLALGPGGAIPRMPSYPDQEQYNGLVMHSASYKTARQWKGKSAIIIGSANTAHDVAEDMVEAGLSSITMVQRSQTAVIPVEYSSFFNDRIYNNKLATEEADRLALSLPIVVTRLVTLERFRVFANRDTERFDALERVGFKLDRDCDLWEAVCDRIGGHHLDVGCGAKIVRGEIKMKSDAMPVRYTPTGIRFSDGSELDADIIIFTTGFEGNMRDAAAQLVGNEIGQKLEDYWRVDMEGEFRGVWKPIGHPGIWYTGGSIAQARYFSRFLALQIKADVEGVPLERYTKTPA